MMMTNGFGAILGSWSSGIIIDTFFKANNGDFIWKNIWLTFALYSLVVALLFLVLFKHKHNPKEIGNITH
jgi:NHS family xanthosine MFS transporter